MQQPRAGFQGCAQADAGGESGYCHRSAGHANGPVQLSERRFQPAHEIQSLRPDWSVGGFGRQPLRGGYRQWPGAAVSHAVRAPGAAGGRPRGRTGQLHRQDYRPQLRHHVRPLWPGIFRSQRAAGFGCEAQSRALFPHGQRRSHFTPGGERYQGVRTAGFQNHRERNRRYLHDRAAARSRGHQRPALRGRYRQQPGHDLRGSSRHEHGQHRRSRGAHHPQS